MYISTNTYLQYSTNIKTWLNDLGMVSKATEGINMSIMAVGAADYAKAIDGLTLSQAQLLLSLQGVDAEQQKHILLQAGLIASSDKMSAQLVHQALETTGLSVAERQQMMTELGLMDKKTKNLILTNSCTEAELRAQLTKRGYIGTAQDEIVTSILGTSVRGKEAISWDVLTGAIKRNIAEMLKWLVTNPIGQIGLIIASVGLLSKGYNALIGQKEKLADTKLEGLDEEISNLDTEIQSLESLQEKLKDAKGSKSELAKIQNELNDAIGETKGLINGEGDAYEIANTKLKAFIESKKQERDALKQDKIDGSKDKFDNNAMETDKFLGFIGFDVSAEQMRDNAKEYQRLVDYYNSLPDDSRIKKRFENADDYVHSFWGRQSFDWKGWSDYWDEQVKVAYDAFDAVIEDYEGYGGQDFIKNLINNMVRDGSDFTEISNAIQAVIDNDQMQEAINTYWESLVNPDIDSEKALENVKKAFDEIIKLYPGLEDFFDGVYERIITGSGEVATATEENANKMTVLLSDLEKTSENIKTLGTAFKELSDDGYITTKTLGEIKTATGLSGVEWDIYQSKLLNAKKGSSEFNQVMSDLTYKILDNAFAEKDLNAITEQQVAAILRENGVINATAVAQEYLNKKKAEAYIQDKLNSESIEELTGDTLGQAKACGIAEESFKNLIVQMILSGNTTLSFSEQIEALKELGFFAKWAGDQIKNIKSFSTPYGEFVAGYDENGRLVRVEKFDNMYDTAYDMYDTIPDFSGAGNGSGSDKNEALDNYLKEAERRYKIHQDEERYIKDLQYAKDNLVKTDEEQLDILEKIDEAYRDYADNRIKDIEHQIDMEKQLYGEDAVDPTAKYEKIKEIAHDAAEAHRKRLREMGYDDVIIEKTDEIQNYQKQYMDAVKAIDDFRESANSNFLEDYLESLDKVYEKTGDGVKYINDLKWVLDTYEMTDEEKKDLREKIDEAYQSVADDDITEIENRISINTEVYGDSYDPVKDYQDKIRIAQGEINRLLSSGYTADSQAVQDWAKVIIDAEGEIAEYQLGLYEQINQRVASFYEFRYNKEQALINGLQKQYDLHKQIRDERTELESELDASKSLEGWLDEKTRDQLFNEGDFAELTEKLDDISGEIDDIYSDYEKQISSLSIDEWYKEEEITAAFEARIEAQMESYEIAKKELEVEKKRNELQNVLNQRNTRVMTAGGWRQVADPAAVYEKQKELSKLEAEKTNLEADKAQSEIIRNRQLLNNATNTERLAIENRINMINDMTEAERKAYASRLPSTDSLKAMLALVGGTDVAMLDKGMNSILGNILNLDDSETGNRYNSTIDYMSMMKDMPISDDIANGLNDVRNDKIKADKLPYVKLSQEELLKMSIPITGVGLSAMSQGLNLFKNFSPVIHGQLPSVSQSHIGSSQNHYTFGDIIITNPVRDANDIVRELSVKMTQNFDLTKNMKQ